VKFNYVQFNDVAKFLGRLKNRFPHAEHFVFEETNISLLGQLNALAEIQGLTSIRIEIAGNPIVSKDWKTYAVFRLAHWGLVVIDGKQVYRNGYEKRIRRRGRSGPSISAYNPDILLLLLLLSAFPRLQPRRSNSRIESMPAS